MMRDGSSRRMREDFDAWCDAHPEAVKDYGGVYGAAIDQLFAPRDDYGDPVLDRLFEVYDYVKDQPCLCTPAMVADLDPCPRCRVLNESGAGR